MLGNEHSSTLTSRSNLARWMGEAGHLEDAISSGIDVVADQQRILGYDHPDTLTSRGNLAMALGQSGRVVEAITVYEELLEDMRRVLGDDHPIALTSRGNLAGCLRACAGRRSLGAPAVSPVDEFGGEQQRDREGELGESVSWPAVGVAA